jgi:transcriptional regulator with XRE-family HTH domain
LNFQAALEESTGMSAFGDLLRQYRERATHPTDGKKLGQQQLADLMGAEIGIESLTGATISNWERGKYSIDHNDRLTLTRLIKTLHTCGGIRSLAEANALLAAGNYRPLDDDEISAIAPTWVKSAAPLPHHAPSSSAPNLTPAIAPHGILGRARELDQIFNLLRLDDPTPDIPPVALRGMGGVGKTTLALAIGRADLTAQFFPDGVLWASPGLKPSLRATLDQWGQALGENLLAERDLAACQNRLRALLFQRRMLLIVDDVWDVRHAQTFALGGPHCRMVFTTRESPIAYELATMPRTLNVNVLGPEAALDLLRRLAPLVVVADETRARVLCERLEFLPLALTLAGRALANAGDLPERARRLLDELIERSDARMQLPQTEARSGLDDAPISLRKILGLSVERLDARDQDRFAMLATFGGEPLTAGLDAIAAVWDCTLAEAEATLERLIHVGLLERRGERYWMHALFADYAAELQKERGL